MTPEQTSSRILYAAVSAEDARTVRASTSALAVVVEGDTAAITGSAPRDSDVLARALDHNRVIARLLEYCSSIVPFRLGVTAPKPAQLRELLRTHASAFERQLARVRDRVEVGVKIKVRCEPDAETTFDLAPVYSLVPQRCDRQEALTVLPDGMLFEGVYLIQRATIEEFWAALDRMRADAPERAFLGVGPFAPYSFCDLQIEHATE